MVEVRRSTIVDVPIEEVWAVVRDFNGHDRWHPAVAQSRIEDGLPPDMVGAVRDFRLADGSRIREQLLSLSDRDHCFDYCILEAPLPLTGYVARVRLRPVTDGNRTLWEWHSRFDPPSHRRTELTKLVSEGIYEAGFRAIKDQLRGRAHKPAQPPVNPAPAREFNSTGEIVANAHAIVMERHGGPEVLLYQPVTIPLPGPGEVRIRQRAIGVNFIDVYTRTGYFNLVQPPGIPGMEAAGIIESVGQGVTAFSPGDRVGYACAPPGAYTDLRVMQPDLLVHLPSGMSEELAAASLLKGIAASFLLHEVHAVKSGDVVLVHAVAGGVGLMLAQWASACGAQVIGTTSSEEKAATARAAGCSHVIIYTAENFTDAVMAITGGRGCDVVYDAVGKDTFEGSVRALKTRGHLVSFGQASGDIGTYDIGSLASRSVTLSRPNYGHYTSTAETVHLHSSRFFDAVRTGQLALATPTSYSLRDASKAHADLEFRRTSGALILIP